MSDLTRSNISLREADRPVALIKAVIALQVLAYLLSDHTKTGDNPVNVWTLLDAYLLRKLWGGSYGAWAWLVALTVGVIVMIAMTWFADNMSVDGGPLLLVRSCLELALLLAPAMRRWVSLD